MTPVGSVSTWLEQLKGGEEATLDKLHERYRPVLVGLAQRKLKGCTRRALDEEDVAQQTFWGFYRSLKAGRLSHLTNRHELLALLTHITACQAANQIQHEVGVAKRGGGKVQGESVLDVVTASGEHQRGMAQVEDRGVSPPEQALLDDCYQRYVGAVPENLRAFAELRLAGFTHQKIADRMGCTERTVDRKIALIMAKWQRMAAESMNRHAT